jgi:TonB family protein
LLSERVFLAFDTGRGLAYVQASGWQRAYLLWTFRNFRSLPQNILNTRQHKLVETLYCATSINPRELDEDTLIGTVDDFRSAFPAPVPVSATPEKLVLSIPAQKSADGLNRNYRGPRQAPYARLEFSGLTRRFGAGALVAIMAVLGGQQLRNRPLISLWNSKSSDTPRPSAETRPYNDRAKDPGTMIVPAATTMDAQPVSVVQIASAAPIPVMPLPTASLPGVTASQSLKPLRSTEQGSNQRGPNQSEVNTHRVVAARAGVQDAASALPRIQISGPPQRIVYPDCPDNRVRGKVSLRAVVDYQGKVNQVRVLTGNRLLAAAAERAIRQWRYQPFSGDTQRFERETRITVSFISSDVVAVSFPDAAPVSR